MMRLLPCLVLLVGLAPLAMTQAPAADSAQDVEAETPVVTGLHAPFDALLREHVRAGIVDYAGFQRDASKLDAYIAALGRTKPDSLEGDARVAYYVNAYNAFTLKLILNWHDRIDGIKDIPSSKRWKHARWSIGGERHSLDQIEHEILRPMGDPRVHFALVCASKSCPDLRSEAYLPERLDDQLDDAARAFLADEKKGLVTRTESGFFGKDPNVYVSKIFSWFDDDFEQDGKEVLDFLREYAPADAVDYMRRWSDDLDIEYLDYDWTLNDKPLR
jgi:hypothetical protein